MSIAYYVDEGCKRTLKLWFQICNQNPTFYTFNPAFYWQNNRQINSKFQTEIL
ncbi:hypothetical protein KsCSTR_23790 [Candidatus Kuenenia stuttgartiensis]|uniref:Uncharacterized protein n=1 Tax=Kuenenia stuttgartiensis TaxID=174633 RepID=Q1Q3R0_KUEST|nr:hypothetical protein KsCSTR_23790 [Candidatus Kuenenia stuttgartiensis]CAJ74651.1 unknown protein [Candidatus Kuenenia stuttgartiensis]